MQPWYVQVDPSDADLYQGQIFDNFGLLLPNYEKSADEKESLTGKLTGKIVILSQTCDLIAKDVKERQNVLVAPVTKLPSDTKSSGLGDIARARNHWYYPLGRDDAFGMENMVVRLDAIGVVPFSVLATFAKGHGSFRLCRPFVEHLGHFVGEFFARVALPDKALDIEEFKETIREKIPDAPQAFPGKPSRPGSSPQ